MPAKGEVTVLLEELAGGDASALDRLLPLVYDELRAIAHRQLRNEDTGHTLNTTALVHEGYLKLAGLDRLDWRNRAQFFAIASRAIRRILVDYAVGRKAQKRGGGQVPTSLDQASGSVTSDALHPDDVLALDEALTRLEAQDERLCRVVECRVFCGMTVADTSEALGVSPATVERDWLMARAYLNCQLGP